MPPLSRFLAATCVALSLLAGSAGAQQLTEDGVPYAETADELDALMWQRDRELLHTGIPLTVVGLEQGENQMRSRTPALMRTDGRVAMVDADELRERKLAMYSEGATFHRPLKSTSRSAGFGASDGGRLSNHAQSPSADASQGVQGLSIGWLLGMLAAVLCFVVAWRARNDLA